MTNRFRDPVGYRPFRTQPLLAEGLLAVARPGGELLDKVAAGMFRLADEAGQVADRQAAFAGKRAGEAAALAGAPNAEFDPGTVGGHGKARGGSFAPEVNAAIDRAAAEEGVDPTTLRTIAQIESGGNPNAKNPTSSAEGLFQFIDSTAQQVGLVNKRDAYQSSKAAAKLLKANGSQLRKVLGRDATPGELYLAHQQGGGGAAALLKNPNAKATDVVGAAAVRLNGGKPGMTAGQFARLWIDKAENGYVMPSEPGQIVTGSTATGGTGVKLSGGRYRPTGSDTIYGRAYDEAGSRVYLQELETEMRSTTSQVFEKYKDDPVALGKALGDLGGALAKDHVFDEIRADFATGYGRLAESYLSQARDNQAAKIKAQDQAAFIERTGSLQTDVQTKIEQFDPKNPNAADAIASSQAALDEHFDDAVARGIMQPDDAARQKIESRRNTALGFYGKQAEALDADGVKELRAKMKADMADGGIAGLDSEGWQTLDAGLENLETKKRAAAERVKSDFRDKGDSLAARVAAGFDVPPADLAKLALAAGATPEGKAQMQETYAKISAGRAIRDMTTQQARAHVAGLRKQYGDAPTDGQLRTLAFAESMLASKEKAIAADPVSYAEGQGIVPATPLLTEAETSGDMESTMQARIKSADEAARHFGITPRYLKAGEAAAVAAAVRADPAKGVGIAGAIVAGAGDHAADVLAEFGADAPVIAESGAIIAFGGSAQAAQDVIAGYGKDASGKPMKGLKADAQAENFRDVTGAALSLATKDRSRIDAAAASIARKRISESGVDPTSDEAIAIHGRAVQEAAGATFDRGVQYGGFADVGGGIFSAGAKVLVPPQMRADRFGEVLAAITDADLATLKVKPKAGAGFFAGGRSGPGGRAPLSLAATLSGATPVIMKGGYAFAYGDPASDDPQFVAAEDGSVFVLDLTALAPALAARVPGAFR